MYIVHIFVEGVPNPFGLRFKAEETAREAADQISVWVEGNHEHTLVVEDAFGQSVSLLRLTAVMGVQVIDIAQDMDVQLDIARMRAQREQSFAKEQQLQQANGLVLPANLVRPN